MSEHPTYAKNKTEKLPFLKRIARKVAGNLRSRHEVIEVLQHAYKDNILSLEALTISEGALHLATISVGDVMIPRVQTSTIQADCSVDDIMDIVIKTAHSRYPMMGDDLDDVKGILLAKDLLKLSIHNKLDCDNIQQHLRPAILVPESKTLDAMLRDFRKTKNHMAIVVNEYGGMAGIITIEDVLEQIVGEIEDEHDSVDESLQAKPTGKANEWMIKGLMPIDEFNTVFKTKFSTDVFDTMGGLLTNQFGYLPKLGEQMELAKYKFTVVNSTSRRILLMRVNRLSKT